MERCDELSLSIRCLDKNIEFIMQSVMFITWVSDSAENIIEKDDRKYRTLFWLDLTLVIFFLFLLIIWLVDISSTSTGQSWRGSEQASPI